MSVAAPVYDAFASLLQAFADAQAPALPVSYPGVPFTPPEQGQWLEASFFPNETLNYGIGTAGPFLHQGFLQVLVCERVGSGVMTGLALADAVVAHFGKGTQVGPVKVERAPWVGNVLTATDRMSYPVSIPYKALLRG